MIGVFGIITLLLVLGLSLLITKIATRALTLTGLSEESAKFQARSAFTGTGFTTREAEKVVDHPARREIITILMILRSAGLVTIIISLILSFVGTAGEQQLFIRLGWLAVGVLVLWGLASSKRVDRRLTKVIEWGLRRWTRVEARDYLSLLRLTGPYEVQELKIQEGDWLADKSLNECELTDEGVLILGIKRDDGDYVGAPTGDTEIYEKDTLILYGRKETLKNLNERRADMRGEQEHKEAVSEQEREMARQEEKELEHKRKKEKERRSPPN